MSKCPLFAPYLSIPSPLSLQKVHELGSQCLAVSFQLEGQEGVSSRPPPMAWASIFQGLITVALYFLTCPGSCSYLEGFHSTLENLPASATPWSPQG